MATHDEPQTTATEHDENMAAWEAGVQRMKAELQARSPELFDESGELIMERAMELFRRTAEERGLTLTELYIQSSRNLRRQADAL